MCVVLLHFGRFTFLLSVCFEGDSSSGFTIEETFELVMLWAYAALRRVCPRVFKVSSYFANIL